MTFACMGRVFVSSWCPGMSYSQMLYSKIREYVLTSTDHLRDGGLHASQSSPALWMFVASQSPENSYDEVYPGIYMGDSTLVRDKPYLKKIGITHVVNCSQGNGSREINTDSRFYRDAGIKYHGIKAIDNATFNMMPFFKDASEFIDKALKGGGKVYVHCFKGVSRSATVVLAFLMLKRNTDLTEAVRLVRAKRKIHPNDGFIRQLCILDKEIFGYPYT